MPRPLPAVGRTRSVSDTGQHRALAHRANAPRPLSVWGAAIRWRGRPEAAQAERPLEHPRGGRKSADSARSRPRQPEFKRTARMSFAAHLACEAGASRRLRSTAKRGVFPHIASACGSPLLGGEFPAKRRVGPYRGRGWWEGERTIPRTPRPFGDRAHKQIRDRGGGACRNWSIFHAVRNGGPPNRPRTHETAGIGSDAGRRRAHSPKLDAPIGVSTILDHEWPKTSSRACSCSIIQVSAGRLAKLLPDQVGVAPCP